MAARSRAESATAASEVLAQLPPLFGWTGLAAIAAREAITITRAGLDAHAEEDRALSRAIDRAADDIERLKSSLRALDDDAQAADLIIDRLTATVLPDNGFRGNTEQLAADTDAILARLNAIVAEANAVDAELAEAVAGTGIRFPTTPDPAALSGPEDRKTWWESLSRATKDALLEHDPDGLGNCDGIPVADRNIANLTVMNRDIDRVDQTAFDRGVTADEVLTHPERFGLNMTDAMRYISAVRVKGGIDYNRSQTGAEVLLYLYRPQEFGGQGRAAITIGDPDNADHTVVLVPGTGNSVANGWLIHNDEAINLYTETSVAAGLDRTVSVLTWMGYDAPDAIVDPRVAQSALARRGGAALASDVNALNVTHRGTTHVTVIGHSYGATVVADAAAGYGMRSGDVVLVGSPGTDLAATASDFHLPGTGHVYVGSAATDLVTNLAGVTTGPVGLGADPAADGFGSTRFKAEVAGWTPGSWTDHEHYFDNGSESLYSIADITSGHGAALQDHGMTAPHRDSILGPLATRLGLPDWSNPLTDPELTRPATTGHYHHRDHAS